MLLTTSSVIMHRLLEDGDRDATADSESGMRADSSRKRKDPPSLGRNGQFKKRSGPNQSQIELHYELRIRGRETVGENTQISHKPRSGHIRFKDRSLTGFSGQINIGGSIGAIRIEGFKISGDDGKQPPDLMDFSEAAFEREREVRQKDDAVAEKERKKAEKLCKKASRQTL